jgi:hypothetical protein
MIIVLQASTRIDLRGAVVALYRFITHRRVLDLRF